MSSMLFVRKDSSLSRMYKVFEYLFMNFLPFITIIYFSSTFLVKQMSWAFLLILMLSMITDWVSYVLIKSNTRYLLSQLILTLLLMVLWVVFATHIGNDYVLVWGIVCFSYHVCMLMIKYFFSHFIEWNYLFQTILKIFYVYWIFILGKYILFETEASIYKFLGIAIGIDVTDLFLSINILIIMFSLLAMMTILSMLLRNLIEYSRSLKRISSLSLDLDIIDNVITNGENKVEHVFKVVVFGDIRGFTEFTENEYENEAMVVLKGFYEIIENQVLDFGGFKPEFIADEFVTFFDEIEKAIDFCFDVKDKLNPYLCRYKLGIGLGVSSGLVVGGLWGGRGSKKYTYIGRTVNLASRLQSIAGSGEIFVDKGIYKKMCDKISLLEVKSCLLKGLEKPVDVYSICEKRPTIKDKVKFKGFTANKKNRISFKKTGRWFSSLFVRKKRNINCGFVDSSR